MNHRIELENVPSSEMIKDSKHDATTCNNVLFSLTLKLVY